MSGYQRMFFFLQSAFWFGAWTRALPDDWSPLLGFACMLATGAAHSALCVWLWRKKETP